MSIQKVASELVKLCSAGKLHEAMALYSPDIVSVEPIAPPGQSREAKGIAAVKAKDEAWSKDHEVHSVKVEGPLISDSHFAVTFKMDFTDKPHNKRMTMEELAVYQVAGDKIVHEEFFYSR
jgi:hypothetical protein